MDDVKTALPTQPSRESGRQYVWFIFVLATVEAVAVPAFDFQHWQVLAALNALPLSALLIAKSATTLDLNKWMDSAVRMVEARRT